MTIRIPEEDKRLIKAYADIHGVSAAEFMRSSAMERIEDEFDLKELNEAMANWDGTGYTFAEVKAMFPDD
jgi:uncharacterized protein (DUF1778 family)